MKISVLIPTYNRSDILKGCLDCLRDQDFDHHDYEVLVVDDGSSDETQKILKNYQTSNPNFNLRFLKQKNQGQGMARNYGLAHTKGEVIVLLGDDMFVKKDFLFQHWSIHLTNKGENHAVLGLIEWHPEIKVTAFMKWLTNGSSIFGKFGGHQFAFEKLKDKEFADFNFFYTSNISIKRSLLLKEQFDPKFKSYGWEDIELGYRLTKKHKLIMHYNEKAISYHHHEINDSSFMNRMQMIGKSTIIIDSVHPELAKRPSKLKQLIFKIGGNSLLLRLLKMMKNDNGGLFFDFYYYFLSKKYFLEGYYAGLKDENV